jgi:hypothetical protein
MADNVEIVIKAIDNASGVIDSVANSLGGLGKVALGVAAAGITAAATALGFLVKKGMESQDTMARFNALVSNSPLAGFEGELLKLADAYSKTTKFENDSIIAAEGQLAVYGATKEIMPDLIKQTLNLAEFMKTDATSAAQTLGRAFSDINGGSLTMLYRQKLITQQEKEHAEYLARHNKEAQAQAFLLDILNNKIGKLAETMGATLSGRMTIFANTLEQLAQDMGEKLLPALSPLMDKLQELAIKVAPLLTDALEKYVIPALTKGVDAITGFLDKLMNIDWGKLNWHDIGQSITDAINGIDWEKAGENTAEGIGKLAEAIKKNVDSVDWGELFSAIGKGFHDFLHGIGEALQKVWAPVWESAAMVVENWSAKVGGAMDRFLFHLNQTWANNWHSLVAIVINAMAVLEQAILYKLSAIKNDFFNGFSGAMQQANQAMLRMRDVLVDTLRNIMAALRAIVAKGITIMVNYSLGKMPGTVGGATGGVGGVGGGSGGAKSKRQHGGIIDEPVFGVGQRTGKTWSFAEDGRPETVLPYGASRGGSMVAVTVNINSTFSLADQREAEQKLTPIIQRAIRQARLTSV